MLSSVVIPDLFLVWRTVYRSLQVLQDLVWVCAGPRLYSQIHPKHSSKLGGLFGAEATD